MAMSTVTGKNSLGHTKTLLAAENPSGHLAAATVLVDKDGNYKSGRIAPDEMLKTYLLNGSSIEMKVNGSVTPVIFKYTVPTGKILLLVRMIIYLSGSTDFADDKFGNQTALTNGVEVAVDSNVWEIWKDNIDLTTCMFDTEGRKVFAKDTKSIGGRWTFSKEVGGPIELVAGEIISVTINDNLSGLDHFRAKIGGRLIDA